MVKKQENKNIIIFNEIEIKWDKDSNLFNLTNMWKASGGHKSQQPFAWLRQDESRKFLKEVDKKFKTASQAVLESRKGRYGGTYAHWQIALAYAKYLSPEFHMYVNEIFVRYKIADPILAADIAERAPLADTKWLAARVEGIVARKEWAATLASRGTGKPYHYVHCTNKIYKALLGKTAKQLKEAMGLVKSGNLRDNLPTEELISIAFSEVVSKNRMEKRNLYGYRNCSNACEESAEQVRQLLEE